MPEFFRRWSDPLARWQFSLGTCMVLAWLASYFLAQELPRFGTLGVLGDILPAIFPALSFFPLLLVARTRLLTPLSMSLAFSVSIGMIATTVGFILPLDLGGAFSVNAEMVLHIELRLLFYWFLYSFHQAFMFSGLGFTLEIPVFYILSYLGILVRYWRGNSILIMPLIGIIYCLLAVAGVARMHQFEPPLREVAEPGLLSTPNLK